MKFGKGQVSLEILIMMIFVPSFSINLVFSIKSISLKRVFNQIWVLTFIKTCLIMKSSYYRTMNAFQWLFSIRLWDPGQKMLFQKVLALSTHTVTVTLPHTILVFLREPRPLACRPTLQEREMAWSSFLADLKHRIKDKESNKSCLTSSEQRKSWPGAHTASGLRLSVRGSNLADFIPNLFLHVGEVLTDLFRMPAVQLCRI